MKSVSGKSNGWIMAMALSVSAALAMPAAAVDVDVVITVDNAYGFGFGSSSGMTTTSYYGGLRNISAAEITNGFPVLYTAGDANPGNGYTNPGVGPEAYDLNSLPASDYLYLVAWSDDTSLQGALGSFTVGSTTVGTVPGVGWEVFATGRDRDSTIASDTLTNSPTDIALINSQIAIANANAGGAGTSIGWVNESGLLPDGSAGSGELAFGDDNTGGAGGTHPFGAIAGIDSAARWMWYNEDPGSIANPFSAGPEGPDGHNEFLIFRLPVSHVPEPSSIALLLVGAAGLLRRRG
ncbi:MAG: PEP-CTERM sorting domain-containing protein [Phycisphaerales bacterium]|nr:PEP-CTERM sorting domain-containing protein [Phycisphaerales bacterium]